MAGNRNYSTSNLEHSVGTAQTTAPALDITPIRQLNDRNIFSAILKENSSVRNANAPFSDDPGWQPVMKRRLFQAIQRDHTFAWSITASTPRSRTQWRTPRAPLAGNIL